MVLGGKVRSEHYEEVKALTARAVKKFEVASKLAARTIWSWWCDKKERAPFDPAPRKELHKAVFVLKVVGFILGARRTQIDEKAYKHAMIGVESFVDHAVLGLHLRCQKLWGADCECSKNKAAREKEDPRRKPESDGRRMQLVFQLVKQGFVKEIVREISTLSSTSLCESIMHVITGWLPKEQEKGHPEWRIKLPQMHFNENSMIDRKGKVHAYKKSTKPWMAGSHPHRVTYNALKPESYGWFKYLEAAWFKLNYGLELQ